MGFEGLAPRMVRKESILMRKFRVFVSALVLSVLMSMSAFAGTEIGLNLDWKYAANSKINTGNDINITVYIIIVVLFFASTFKNALNTVILLPP